MSRTLIASLALGAALTLSGAAFAQTTINGTAVSEADLPKVQAQCDALSTQAATEDSASVSSKAEAGTDSNNGGNPETSDPAATDADGTNTTAASIDLDTITLDQCKEAGLIK